jgi:hypothetical protein
MIVKGKRLKKAEINRKGQQDSSEEHMKRTLKTKRAEKEG